MYYAAIGVLSCVTVILVISQVVTITVFAVAWRRQKRNFHQQIQRSKSSIQNMLRLNQLVPLTHVYQCSLELRIFPIHMHRQARAQSKAMDKC